MSARAARLDIRTTQPAKLLIENAASFLGITISAFILECAVEKAAMILQQAEAISLNAYESKQFLAAIENPSKPNANLKRLFEKHKK